MLVCSLPTKSKAKGKVNMVLNVHRNHKACWVGGGGGMEGGGGGRLYTYRYTVTTRMTSALRWAAMKAINCEGQSHKTVSTDHNF